MAMLIHDVLTSAMQKPQETWLHEPVIFAVEVVDAMMVLGLLLVVGLATGER